MDVSAHRHGTLDALYVALLAQDLLGLLTQDLDLVLGQLLAFHQLLNPCVKVFEVLLIVCVHGGKESEGRDALV